MADEADSNSPPTAQTGIASAIAEAAALARGGRWSDAETVCRRVLAEQAAHPAALNLLAVVLMQRGDDEGAIAYCRAALEADPRFTKARSNLAVLLLRHGDLAGAEQHFLEALNGDPGHAAAHAGLGQIRIRQGRGADAVELLSRASLITPDDAMTWSNLGAAQLLAGQDVAAVNSLRRALELAPRLVAAWTNLANACDRLDRPQEMAVALTKALAETPASAELHTALGIALRRLGRDDEALAAHDRALNLHPNLPRAHFNRAMILLARGAFAEGWRDFRFRPSAQQSGPQPQMLPQDLTGRQIFLRSNQGLGDELFFLRFAPELKHRGAFVTYQSGPKIAALLRRASVLDAVAIEPRSSADITLLVDDLPYVLGHSETDRPSAAVVPPPLPLAPIPERLVRLRNSLAALGPAPHIALTWRAGIDALGRMHKTIPQREFAAALADIPGTLVSVQRAPAPGEVEAFAAAVGRPVHDLGRLNDDLEDMLAVMALVDEYVGVSNTNTHLRASAGRPSRVLVPFPPDYRWMANGDESPWFPGTRVYRQACDRSWDDALAQLVKDLAAS